MFDRRLVALLPVAGLLLVLLAAGCRGSGNFDEIHPGMGPLDVEDIMGHQGEATYGEGTDADQVVWVYPEGKVLFVRWAVVQVEKTPAAPKPEAPRR